MTGKLTMVETWLQIEEGRKGGKDGGDGEKEKEEGTPTSGRDTFRRVAGRTGGIPWRWRSAAPASRPWSSPERASSLRGEATALPRTAHVFDGGGDSCVRELEQLEEESGEQ